MEGKESLFSNHSPVRELAGWHVHECVILLCSRDVCYLCYSAIQYLPSRSVITTLPRALVNAARKNGRESDPYGGTMKLTTDVQFSSKPDQDLITIKDRHPHFIPGP